MNEYLKFLELSGSPKKAAEILGCTIGQISNMKTGQRGISSDTAIKIVEAFPQLSLYELLKKESSQAA